jgi:hypothetical protein
MSGAKCGINPDVGPGCRFAHPGDRMPVILAPTDYARRLREDDPRDLMRPFPADPMRMWPTSTRVNKPENERSPRSRSGRAGDGWGVGKSIRAVSRYVNLLLVMRAWNNFGPTSCDFLICSYLAWNVGTRLLASASAGEVPC